MAPPLRKVTPGELPDSWWKNAYVNQPDIHVQYELQFKKDLIKPGTKIKIKYMRGVFKFRCLAHNVKLDSTWIDCIGDDGAWHSFRVEQLKNVVKPKRSRRKKANT